MIKVVSVLLLGSALSVCSSITVVSTKKSGGHVQLFDDDRTNLKNTQATELPNLNLKVISRRTVAGLRSTFLPVGYPTSVPDGYMQYAVWSWIQDFTTSLRSVLATQRILQGVGVGSNTATAMAATQNFLIRDAAGMAAVLLFTSVAQFNTDIKRWRLFADIMVDIGITLEVAAVQVPRSLFLPMICLGNMCKAVCGVASGACGGAIAVFWSSRGTDIADINSKFGAQHTVTAALGLALAAIFAKSIANAKKHVVWSLFSILTFLHIFANMRCMRLISFQHLNTSRLNMVLDYFLERWIRAEPTQQLPTPKEVSRKEPLFFIPKRTPLPIRFGVSFNEFSKRSNKNPIDLASTLQTQSYIVSGSLDASCIVVSIAENTTPLIQTQAYFHAALLGRAVLEVTRQNKSNSLQGMVLAEQLTLTELPKAWSSFRDNCKDSGWDLLNSEVRSQGYEISVK